MAGFLDVLLSYSHLVVPVFFAGFFLVTLIALIWNENRYVRTSYAAGLVSALLVTGLVLSFNPLPLVHWHKFSTPQEQTQTMHQFRVVDAQGEELAFDAKATLSGDADISMHLIHNSHADRSPSERRTVMRYLLNQSREHRSDLQDRSPWRFLRFPHHSGHWGNWSPETVAGYDRFVGIRLYEITVTTSDDGQRITNRSERVVDEYYDETPANETQAAVEHASTGRDTQPSSSRQSPGRQRAVGLAGGIAR